MQRVQGAIKLAPSTVERSRSGLYDQVAHMLCDQSLHMQCGQKRAWVAGEDVFVQLQGLCQPRAPLVFHLLLRQH